MDPSSFLSPIFLCALAFLSFAFLIYKHKFSNSASKNLPPGRTGWPVIGESIAFLAASTAGHPETFTQKRMAKYSPKVYKTSLFCEPVAAFCGQAGHKFLFSNEYKLVNAWWPKSVDKVFPLAGKTTSKEESKRMKKILPHFLKPELLQKYIGIMDIVCQRHFALDWDGKQQVTVLPMAKKFTFWVACKVFLSVEDPAYVAKFAGPFNTLATGMVTVPIDIPGTPFNRAIKASKIIQEDILQIIKQRKIELAENRASPTQDILSHMLTSPDGDGQFMTDDDITDKILGLLIGGHDTASGVITYIFKFLAEHPQVYQRVYDEQMEIASSKAPGDLLSWEDLQKMKYSWQVACEVMRLAPPLQGGFREALKEFTFEGYTIPKGWKLYWTANSTHKNPEYFKDPEMFDPSRFEGSGPAPYTFVPFGGGPRMCPGKEYARLETLVFMHNLVKRYKWEKVIPNEKTTVNPLRAPVHGLPIRVYPLNKTA